MATSSILGGEHAPPEPRGTDVDSLGPSDTSDSGSDVQTDRRRSAVPDGIAEGALSISHGTDTDSTGTGERASADPTAASDDADILPDRVGTVPYEVGEVTDAVDDPTAATAGELAEDTDDLDSGDGEGEDEDDGGDDGAVPRGRPVPIRRSS